MMLSRHRKGLWSEAAAIFLLQCKGYRLLGARVRTPVGEVDALMRRGPCLVVVEVKFRTDAANAVEALSPRQRHRLERAARYLAGVYQLRYGLTEVRFDVVALAPWHWPHHLVGAWRSSF